jgi:hypothetical protein
VISTDDDGDSPKRLRSAAGAARAGMPSGIRATGVVDE